MGTDVKKIYNGPVNGETDVTIDISREQAEELRLALAVVQKYEKIACNAYKTNLKWSPKLSDWCEFEYCVKNDKVIVKIRNGACG